jgi:hypothetical protein
MSLIRHILLVCCLSPCAAFAQKDIFTIENNRMILRLDNRWTSVFRDSILRNYDMSGLSMDTVVRFRNAGKYTADGWSVNKKNKYVYEITKEIDAGTGNLELFSNPWAIKGNAPDSQGALPNAFTDRTFGFNEFRSPSVTILNNGLTLFTYQSSRKTATVYLSGSFNNWSTGGLPMTRNGDIWQVTLPLKAGRYEYKFIVDGKWIRDPENLQKTDDFCGGFNSVYYRCNHTFSLPGRQEVSTVFVSGTFNDWKEKGIKLEKTAMGWGKNVFLPIGAYAYKFIVDGQWITDPTNKTVRPDGTGNFNSFLSIGDPFIFRLRHFNDAEQVILTGSFFNWNPNGLVMNKVPDGWEFAFPLQPGNYEYKYIVDGIWTLDPDGISIDNLEGGVNNLITVLPNHTFRLVTGPNVHSVFVTGSFIDWKEPGIPLKKGPEGWSCDAYLPSGKVAYKFVVDNQWTLDPGNKLWEDNEYNTYNSILWIK